jgi:oligopeptidase B
MAQNPIPTPPLAAQKPKELTAHGHKRPDPYYWLNERDNKEVTDYLRAENAYTEAVMAPTAALQEQIFEEIKGRIKATDASVPYLLDGYYYYNRFEEGKEYPIYCRKKGSLQGKEEILLDVNELAKGKDYCSVVGLSVSDNNELLAFGIDVVGRRKYTIQFKNLRTGQMLSTSIPLTNGNVAWSQDSKYVFYTTKDEQTLRSDKVFRHEVGTDAQKDALVYEEKDETFYVYITRTKSKGYILAGSSSTLTDEVLYLDAKNPKGDFKVFAPRQKGVKYNIDHYKDKFYIVTNWKAINFRLMECPLGKTDYASWRESLPYDERVYLQDIEIFNEFLVLKERKNGLDALRIIRWKDRQSHYVDFGEPTYSAGLSVNVDFNTKVLRYVFSSPLTPASTFDYDMDKRSRKLLKQQEVVGGFKAEDYATEYVFATARDGVKVPISIVYKKGLQKNGAAPCLLYGYGSYGAPMSASFSYSTLSLLDRGFVYAIAHIRGGSEMGRQWYEDGKMFQKKNTFYDFIDCAEYLVKERYTQPERLFAKGGSAGGLLIGAVANMRPDLFKGLIANVPFVDVMTTMLDESIPLTTFEYDEWGNPNDINSYIYMLSYSPYDNVEKKAYPHLLVTTGFHDSQVQYFEPAKWVARLRTTKTDQNLLLFKTDMEAGHSGKTGRFQAIKDTAFEYAFLLKLAGMAAK